MMCSAEHIMGIDRYFRTKSVESDVMIQMIHVPSVTSSSQINGNVRRLDWEREMKGGNGPIRDNSTQAQTGCYRGL